MEKVFEGGIKIEESLKQKAKNNCRKCHGLGTLGRNVNNDEYIPCPCTNKKKS